MIARRFALGSLAAAAAFAFAGCGMMKSDSMGGAMTVPLAASNEVPPNPSSGSGTAKVELDGSVVKWNISYSGTERSGHRRPLPRPGAGGIERRCRRAVRRPARQPDHRLGDADPGAARPAQGRPVVHQPAHRRQPGRRDPRSGEVSQALSPAEAPPVYDRGAFAFSSSRRRSTRRCTLPVVVIGSASMNSISFGYS